MTLKLTFYLSLTSLIFSGLFLSCDSKSEGDNGSTNKQEIDTSSNADSADTDLKESREQDWMLPSPMNVANIFKDAGLAFNPKWMNNRDNAEAYTGGAKRRFNFGVYSADLAYAVMNKKSSLAKKYMKQVKSLADKTGLNAIFDGTELMNEFEESIGDRQEMINVMIQVQESIDDYLQKNDKRYLGVVHFSGAWIEGVSFGARDALNNNNERLSMQLSQQMVILENLIKGLKAYPKPDEFTKKVIQDFENLHSTFEGLQSVKDYDATTEELKLTDQELEKIADLVLSIRENIVKV